MARPVRCQVSQLWNADRWDAEHQALLGPFEERHRGRQFVSSLRNRHLFLGPLRATVIVSQYKIISSERQTCENAGTFCGAYAMTRLTWASGPKCNNQGFFAHLLDQHALTPSNVHQQAVPQTDFMYHQSIILKDWAYIIRLYPSSQRFQFKHLSQGLWVEI